MHGYWVGYTSRYVRTWKDDRMYGYLVGILKDKWQIRRYRIAILNGGVRGNKYNEEKWANTKSL